MLVFSLNLYLQLFVYDRFFFFFFFIVNIMEISLCFSQIIFVYSSLTIFTFVISSEGKVNENFIFSEKVHNRVETLASHKENPSRPPRHLLSVGNLYQVCSGLTLFYQPFIVCALETSIMVCSLWFVVAVLFAIVISSITSC